jgi:hypothetical protein
MEGHTATEEDSTRRTDAAKLCGEKESMELTYFEDEMRHRRIFDCRRPTMLAWKKK